MWFTLLQEAVVQKVYSIEQRSSDIIHYWVRLSYIKGYVINTNIYVYICMYVYISENYSFCRFIYACIVYFC